MGGSNSVASYCYAVPLEGSKKCNGSSQTFRAATHPDSLVEGLTDRRIESCWDIFQVGLDLKGDGPFLGIRKANGDGTLSDYRWRSYREVEKLAKFAGSGLLHTGCVPALEFPDEVYPNARQLRLVGVYSKNREEWFILEQAANAYNMALVPLYDTLGAEALNFVLKQTGLLCIVCSCEVVASLLEVVAGTAVQHIVCMDDMISDELESKVASNGIKLLYWRKVVEIGAVNEQPVSPGTMDDVNTVCYTSGTTGDPKGVLLTHRNIVSTVCAVIRGPFATKEMIITKEEVYISYLPLAHVFERIVCNVVIISGASVGIYSGDTLKLLDDIRVLRPTVFVSVPRLYNRINDKVFGGLSEKSGVLQYLFNSGLNAKMANLRKNGKTTHSLWDPIVFNKTKNFMGGRLRFMVVGGAPLNPTVQERMCCLFCCPLLEGYGMTETMGASFVQVATDPVKGSVGGVTAAIEFKLVSVPEMDYYVEADPPKGELCMRGPGVTPGYFRDTEKTNETIDEDGWLHTGDVCMLLPTMAVKIIDRAKNMFKLAQGEYVAPEKIEGVYQQAFLVAQVFAFGYSTKSFLVGIVVPDSETSQKWAAKNGHAGTSLEDLCKMPKFKKDVEDEMEEVAKSQRLKGFEKIKAFHLHHEQFSVENGILTPTFKLRRHFARQVYQSELDNLCSSLE